MKKRSNSDIFFDFKRAFKLSGKELLSITRPWARDHEEYRKMLEMMDRIRKKMQGEVKPRALRKCLFAPNKNLKMSYFEAMREGKFKEVLADIEALDEGVFI